MVEGKTEEQAPEQDLLEEDLSEVEPPAEALVRTKDLARYDPLHRYLSDINQYPTLSREEEHDLAVTYRETGDREAAYRLVTTNLKLVVKIAMMYRKVYNNLMDLIQEGNLGLIQAIKRFDPERGTRVTTYAAWWIKAYILKFLLDNARLVRIGTTNTRRKILRNLGREKQKLEAKGITPTSRLLAENLGVDERELIEVQEGMSGADISLDAPVKDEGSTPLVDTLNLMEEAVDEKIVQGEFRDMLEKKFEEFEETVSERDQIILRKRLIAESPYTLQQIADMYGVSREAIRVAEKKLTGKLKEFMIDAFRDAGEIELQFNR